jgi:hypothetical protein
MVPESAAVPTSRSRRFNFVVMGASSRDWIGNQ